MTYVVETSEVAEAEIDAAYLWISRQSPEQAGKWHLGLLETIASLSDLPTRCPVAEESSAFAVEVRVLLYGNRQSKYRVLFTIRDALEAGEIPTVRVLHVRHAARERISGPGGPDHI